MTIFALNQILQNMSHLTKEQRYTIFVMKQQGFRNNQIANVIGKDKSVISRELKRNCDKRSGQYRAELAQRKYERRMKEKPKLIKFTKELCRLVETMLKEDYSPEQNLNDKRSNRETKTNLHIATHRHNRQWKRVCRT